MVEVVYEIAYVGVGMTCVWHIVDVYGVPMSVIWDTIIFYIICYGCGGSDAGRPCSLRSYSDTDAV